MRGACRMLQRVRGHVHFSGAFFGAQTSRSAKEIMKHRYVLRASATVLVAGAALSGCGGDNTTQNPMTAPTGIGGAPYTGGAAGATTTGSGGGVVTPPKGGTSVGQSSGAGGIPPG